VQEMPNLNKNLLGLLDIPAGELAQWHGINVDTRCTHAHKQKDSGVSNCLFVAPQSVPFFMAWVSMVESVRSFMARWRLMGSLDGGYLLADFLLALP